MEMLFVLNSARDKEIWQYVVGVAAHLEYIAAAVLWVDDGKPKSFPEYEDTMALGTAANRIAQRGLLDSAITSAALASPALSAARVRLSSPSGSALVGACISRRTARCEPETER